MKEYKAPIQSLIDHIKTALDVDPWAKEMAEELLKEQQNNSQIAYEEGFHDGYKQAMSETQGKWTQRTFNRC